MIPGIYIVLFCLLALLVGMVLLFRWLHVTQRMHWTTGSTFWVLLGWVVAAIFSMTTIADKLSAFAVLIFSGLGQMCLMGVISRLTVSCRFRNPLQIRILALAVVVCGCAWFQLWYCSWFFGEARSVMKSAFKGEAPFIFTVRKFSSFAFTDYTANLEVECHHGVLEVYLEPLEIISRQDGELTFSWQSHPKDRFGQSCTIVTNKEMTIARISYGAD